MTGTTVAVIGTRAVVERAGVEVVGQTDAMVSKMPRVVLPTERA